MKRTCLAIAGTILLSIATDATAASVVLQPGPADVQDTWIWSAENFSHGHWGELRANETSIDQRVLISFLDLTSVPSGATVISAKLGLYRYDGFSGTGLTLDAHQILTPWAETVTYSTQPTFSPVVQSSATITGNGWYEWDVTALTQLWVTDPSSNHGIGIYDHGSSFFQRFQSSDVGGLAPFGPTPPGAGFTPYLEIEYTASVVPLPGAAWMGFALIAGSGAASWRRRRKETLC
jgi:hypothetical protein